MGTLEKVQWSVERRKDACDGKIYRTVVRPALVYGACVHLYKHPTLCVDRYQSFCSGHRHIVGGDQKPGRH